MALVQCKECSKQVSTQAKVCPGCGSPVPESIGAFGYLMVLMVGFIFYKGCSPNTPTGGQVVPAKPEMSIDEKRRIGQTILVMASIKQAMREPDSISWVSVLTSDDASVVCATYRARNGFGGMNIEYATRTKAGISTSIAVWNKHCATNRTLNDMTYVQRGIP